MELLEQQVRGKLDEYDVEYPSESEMMRTIDAIRPFVPVKGIKPRYGNMALLFKQSCREAFYISSLFWMSNGLFLLTGLAAVFLTKQNPYAIMMLLAPIPTLTGLIEVLKSKHAGMAELEMSFKYSLQEIILSRMAVVGGFNLLINLVFVCGASISDHDVSIWKMMMYWIVPFTVITAISFVVVNRFRHAFAAALGLTFWFVLAGLSVQAGGVEKIENVPGSVYLLVIFIAVSVIVLQMNKIYKKGVSYEFNC
ncbi:hypothetical protein FE783_05195 [Paenibacillus mesophilus]|uniref:hypothetical protein n=1 Tax=Paenibacillus mesophilus TaxID=2582849 RepID=UPI00110E47C7|nr:hypothetical protein [Paenibacillus mesophilus]TMV52337.1 hypothetical protein FE783_05195 [Paenibacillus mesophilus]